MLGIHSYSKLANTQSRFIHHFFWNTDRDTHTPVHTHKPLPVWCCFQHKTKPCVGAILCWPKLYALSELCSSTRRRKKKSWEDVYCLSFRSQSGFLSLLYPDLCLSMCFWQPLFLLPLACLSVLPLTFCPLAFYSLLPPLPLPVQPHLLACIVLICTPFSICLPV